MRYRVLHDIIGPRLHWRHEGDTRPLQKGPWGKGDEVEGEDLGDEADVKRLLELRAIEVAPSYPEGHAPEQAPVEKPLAPPPPTDLPHPREVEAMPSTVQPPGRPGRRPSPPTGRDSGTKEE